MCKVLSLLVFNMSSTLLSRLFSVIWLLADKAFYLVSCNSVCSLSNSMMSFWMLYRLEM